MASSAVELFNNLNSNDNNCDLNIDQLNNMYDVMEAINGVGGSNSDPADGPLEDDESLSTDHEQDCKICK